MSTAGAGGTASDATVSVGGYLLPGEESLHRWHVAIVRADEAEAAVANVRQTMKDLEASLNGREPEGAKAARDHIRSLKASMKIREAEASRFRAEAKAEENTP